MLNLKYNDMIISKIELRRTLAVSSYKNKGLENKTV